MRIKTKITRLAKRILLIESRLPGTLQGYLVLVSFLPVSFAVFVLPKMPKNAILELLSIALVFFFWGCAGAVSAIRRELPQLVTLTGRPAFLLGTMWAVTSWGFFLYAVYLVILELF